MAASSHPQALGDPSHCQRRLRPQARAALLALNGGAEAIACFERAIPLNRGDSSAWKNKGFAHFFMGQYAAALPCLEEAERLGATRNAGMIAVCHDKLRT